MPNRYKFATTRKFDKEYAKLNESDTSIYIRREYGDKEIFYECEKEFRRCDFRFYGLFGL